MSQGTPNDALASKTLALLQRKEGPKNLEWLDLLEEVRKKLINEVSSSITLQSLEYQLWKEILQGRRVVREQSRNLRECSFHYTSGILDGQGLCCVQQVFKTHARWLFFWGLLRTGEWVKGRIDVSVQDAGNRVVYIAADIVDPKRLFNFPGHDFDPPSDYNLAWLIYGLTNQANRLIADREQRIQELRRRFKSVEDLRTVLNLKYGPFRE